MLHFCIIISIHLIVHHHQTKQMSHKRALISVYNKEGVFEFAKSLHDLGFELISTGGTFQKLKGKANADPLSFLKSFWSDPTTIFSLDNLWISMINSFIYLCICLINSYTEGGLAVHQVSDVTSFPEILGGRVKTLHPSVCIWLKYHLILSPEF